MVVNLSVPLKGEISSSTPLRYIKHRCIVLVEFDAVPSHEGGRCPAQIHDNIVDRPPRTPNYLDFFIRWSLIVEAAKRTDMFAHADVRLPNRSNQAALFEFIGAPKPSEETSMVTDALDFDYVCPGDARVNESHGALLCLPSEVCIELTGGNQISNMGDTFVFDAFIVFFV